MFLHPTDVREKIAGQRNCPACDGVVGKKLGEKNGFPILSCLGCGTLYTSCFPRSGTEANYNNYYGHQPSDVPEFLHNRADQTVMEFSAYRQSNRLLELGFGAATLLHAAVRAGWEVSGLEISQTAIGHARDAGLKVFCGELHQAAYPDHYFDVVVACELLEHVPDPRSLLTEIARVLRPGGLFWATTPHGRGIAARLIGLRWADICPPDHLQVISFRGMTTLLANSGFRRGHIVTQAANPREIWQVVRDITTGGGNALAGDGGSRREPTENWTRSIPRRAVKVAGNMILGVTRLGDSLRIRVER